MGDQLAASAQWASTVAVADDKPVLPDYAGACNANIVDVLINDPENAPDWFPPGLEDVDQIVFLVLDGIARARVIRKYRLVICYGDCGCPLC